MTLYIGREASKVFLFICLLLLRSSCDRFSTFWYCFCGFGNFIEMIVVYCEAMEENLCRDYYRNQPTSRELEVPSCRSNLSGS